MSSLATANSAILWMSDLVDLVLLLSFQIRACYGTWSSSYPGGEGGVVYGGYDRVIPQTKAPTTYSHLQLQPINLIALCCSWMILISFWRTKIKFGVVASVLRSLHRKMGFRWLNFRSIIKIHAKLYLKYLSSIKSVNLDKCCLYVRQYSCMHDISRFKSSRTHFSTTFMFHDQIYRQTGWYARHGILAPGLYTRLLITSIAKKPIVLKL
jgi:hypothetical protein